VPPNPRPIPRFIADSTQEGIPHGRFAERLAGAFRGACDELAELPEGVSADGELEQETVDQEAISNDRFTLIALDALEGYGDEILMQVKLWSKWAKELASESLYD
jgi:hypothetical protein